MFELEDVKNFKKIDDNLLEVVKVYLGKLEFDDSNPLEDFDLEIESVSFAFAEAHSDEWVDEGKYQYCNEYYQLVAFDKNKAKYPCEKSIVAKYDLCLDLAISRNGSYYSDWYYMYEKPSLFKVEVKTVPEIVIPEHEDVKRVYIK